MRVLITGATGFVGRHIVKLLEVQGHKLALLVRDNNVALSLKNSNTVVIQNDLSTLDAAKTPIKKFNPEVCIHLAWAGIPDYSQQTSRLNLNLSIDFLDFILDSTECNKIIISGSCWEYGTEQGACNESDIIVIKNYFTWAKHALNQYLSIKCAEKGIILNWFRLFFVYGPGQREGSLIPTLIKSISESKVPPVKSPMNKNDFVYVGDVAKTFAAAVVANLLSGVYNLGSGKSTSVYEICRIIEMQLLGTSILSKNVMDNMEQTEIVDFWGDMGKTINGLNIQDNTLLNEGIKLHIHSTNTVINS
jgi:nucleoside-diphosphate-sugar epimerase